MPRDQALLYRFPCSNFGHQRHPQPDPDPEPEPLPHPRGYGAMDIIPGQPAQPRVEPRPAAAPEVEEAHVDIEEDRHQPQDPPPGGPAESAHEADGAVVGTQDTASLSTTPELIPNLGTSAKVQFAKSQSDTSTFSSVVDPSLPAKSSDSEEPKPTTSDSSTPTSMEPKDGEQATPDEGEVSQSIVSTVGPLPAPSKHHKRKHKPSGLLESKTKHTQSSSSDSDSVA